MPALPTNTSTRPNARTVSATARLLSSRRATSPAIPATASPNSARSSSARDATRSMTPTWAPSSTKRATTARPMPEPPPVTNATWRSNCPMVLLPDRPPALPRQDQPMIHRRSRLRQRQLLFAAESPRRECRVPDARPLLSLRAAAADVFVGPAVAMRVGGGLAAGRRHHVDIRIITARAEGATADFQHLRVAVRAVLQAVAVAVIGRKAGGVAGPQYLFARVRNEHDLARQHIDELVLPGVPMALARRGAGRQPQEVDAELGQPGGVAELGALAGAAGLVEGRRGQRADNRGQRGDVDALWHGLVLLSRSG